MPYQDLQATIEAMVVPGKGILAADESLKTIAKRLASINVENSEENRRIYREMLFTAPNLSEYICGVILFEETLTQQASNGRTLGQVLADQGIVPGIKVDKGLVNLPFSEGEKVTQGLDGLDERMKKYKEQGARFAKWRAVFTISDTLPTDTAVHVNAHALARYAAICQENGIVPIVEPEILMDGDHDIEQCAVVTEEVLHNVFDELYKQQVLLEGMILKPSMVIPGADCAEQVSVEEVAQATVDILLRTVPAAVPSINFLSGGQSAELATAHLNAMNKLNPDLPWYLSFSYGRALQAPSLESWHGVTENIEKGKQALHKRAKLNGAAAIGEYEQEMEQA